MNSKVYKHCVARQCTNTSTKFPNKIFIHIPTKLRHKWLKLAGRDPGCLSLKSRPYLCEDHFDLPNDMLNYMEYHIMGTVAKVRVRKECTPTKFDWQLDRKKQTRSTTQTEHILKKQTTIKIEAEERAHKVEQYSTITATRVPEITTDLSLVTVKVEKDSNTTEETREAPKHNFLKAEKKLVIPKPSVPKGEKKRKFPKRKLVEDKKIQVLKYNSLEDENTANSFKATDNTFQDDVSLYDDTEVTIKLEPSEKTNSDELLHEGYKCDHCFSSISGYRYTCVECEEMDLCAACEASGAHDAHYVLRVARPRPEEEIEELLAALRHILKRRPTAEERTSTNSVSAAHEDPLEVAPASLDGHYVDQSESEDETSESEREDASSQKHGIDNTDPRPVFNTHVGFKKITLTSASVKNETSPKRRKLSPSSTISNPKLSKTLVKTSANPDNSSGNSYQTVEIGNIITTPLDGPTQKGPGLQYEIELLDTQDINLNIAKENNLGITDSEKLAVFEQNDPTEQGDEDEMLGGGKPEDKLAHISLGQLGGLNAQRLQETLDEEPLDFILKNEIDDEDPLVE